MLNHVVHIAPAGLINCIPDLIALSRRQNPSQAAEFGPGRENWRLKRNKRLNEKMVTCINQLELHYSPEYNLISLKFKIMQSRFCEACVFRVAYIGVGSEDLTAVATRGGWPCSSETARRFGGTILSGWLGRESCNSPPVNLIPNQMNSLHTHPHCLFKTQFNNVSSSAVRFSNINFVYLCFPMRSMCLIYLILLGLIILTIFG
jgi:hypothetical protein